MNASAANRSVHLSAISAVAAHARHHTPREMSLKEIQAGLREVDGVIPYRGGDAILSALGKDAKDCGGGCGTPAEGLSRSGGRRSVRARSGSGPRESKTPVIPEKSHDGCKCYDGMYSVGDPCPGTTEEGVTITKVVWTLEEGQCVPNIGCTDPAVTCGCYWVHDGGEGSTRPPDSAVVIPFGYPDALHTCWAAGYELYYPIAGSIRMGWNAAANSCDVIVACSNEGGLARAQDPPWTRARSRDSSRAPSLGCARPMNGRRGLRRCVRVN